MSGFAELISRGRRVEGPCPRLIVEDDLWRAFAEELAAGHATLLGLLGRRRRGPHGASHRAGKIRLRRHDRVSGGLLSLDRAHSPASHSAGADNPRSLRPSAGGAAGSTPLARPRALGRALSAGGDARACAARAPISVSGVRRQKPASDSGRPRACRHYRAGPFPFHRQWRSDRAARGAPRLCA